MPYNIWRPRPTHHKSNNESDKVITKAIKLSKIMFMNLQKLIGFLAVTRPARTYVKILFEF